MSRVATGALVALVVIAAVLGLSTHAASTSRSAVDPRSASAYGYDGAHLNVPPRSDGASQAALERPPDHFGPTTDVGTRPALIFPVLAAETGSGVEGGAQAAETVRRFVRRDEFDAIQKALGSGADEVPVGRYSTPDAITSPGVAAQQLALPGTGTNPLVGYFDMPASSLPSEPFATFGPRLVQAAFFQPGFGLGIEVSELFGRPYAPTSGLRLVGF